MWPRRSPLSIRRLRTARRSRSRSARPRKCSATASYAGRPKGCRYEIPRSTSRRRSSSPESFARRAWCCIRIANRSASCSPIKTLADLHRRVRRQDLEELGDVGIAHADAADRARLAHLRGVGAAVDVDVAAHRVDVAQPIAALLAAREPQDAREDPVASRILRMQLGRPHFARRPAPHEHRAERLAGADLRAHDMPAARRAEAAVLFSEAPLRGRDGVALEHALAVEEPQLLLFGIDLDLHRRAAKNRLRIAPHSWASTPPWICTWFFSTCFFGSVAPYTTRAMRAWNIAPTHMSQGSSVT